MIKYIYDNTFEGLLTSIYNSYYNQEKPSDIVRQCHHQEDLFSKVLYIETDMEKADKVLASIRTKISSLTLCHAHYAFLSEKKGISYAIYRYLKKGWQEGRDINNNLLDQDVFTIQEAFKKVGREKHRMLGLVRFKLLERNIYYASIEPDHNITILLAPHFSRRMSDQNWIIHDLKRAQAAIYNQDEWFMTNLKELDVVPLAQEELEYQAMWKKYFKSIAIKERKKKKLQQQFMPKKYWKHLVEMEQ